MNNKCVLYARVSSREQEETGYSLPSQEKILKEYSIRKNLEISKVFSVAESASGSKQRKVFAEMMDYMQKHKINNLLCEKVDRLTRNLKEAVVANDWIGEDENRNIHFIKQNLVLHKFSKSDEKFRWDMEIVLAKKYISNLSEEVRKGQKEKLAQGWLPTKPPLGYKTIGDKGHKIHVPDESTAPFIRRAFDYYASGNYSMKRLAEKICAEGFRTRLGNKPSKSVIEGILGDPFYYGAMRWNDVVYPRGKHEPLTSRIVFDKVQDIRTNKKAPKYQTRQFIFRKLIECGECKGTITAEIHKGIVYYHCSHYRGCTQKKYTTEGKIEEQIMGVFKFFENITEREVKLIGAKIKENHAQDILYKENAIKIYNERHNALQRRLDNLYDDRLDEKISLGFWENKNNEIIAEQCTIQDELTKLKSGEAKYFESWINILDLARRAREIYLKRSSEEKRLLLSNIFSNLVLKDQNVAYTLTKTVERIAQRVQEKLDDKNFFEQGDDGSNKRQKDSYESLCPALLRRQGSNLRPIAYVLSTITNGTDYIISMLISKFRSEGLRG